MYNKTKIIALCVSKAYLYSDFIACLNASLIKCGCRLVVFHTCSDLYWKNRVEESEKAVFELIDYSIVDALIVYSESFYDKDFVRGIINKADRNKKPVVVIGENDPEHISLVFDYKTGFELTVRHVVEEHNMHDVHFLAGVKGEAHSEDRIAVFKKVLCENGIEFSEDMLSYGDYWHIPTMKAIAGLLKRDKLPKALICANDSMAITACQELEKNGVIIPDDVLVTGFDGIKEVEYCDPPITTCKYDLPKFIDKIIYLTAKAIDGEKVTGVYNIDFSLIIHSSCGCPDEYKPGSLVGLLKNSEDCFNGYRENERTLHEILENSVMCDTPGDITEQLKRFDFGDVFIAINQSCFNSSVNPVNEHHSRIFDDRMLLAYPTVDEADEISDGYDKSSMTALFYKYMDNAQPIVLTALGFMGMPFGFLAANNCATYENLSRLPQYANSINTIIGCNRNVRYIKYASNQIEKMSMLDYLTGLYNRSGFYTSLNHILNKAQQTGKHIAVVSVDADGLKKVNDNYGHDSGDYIIMTAADAIKKISSDDKICGRFGGDEFSACLVIDDAENAEEKIKADINSHINSVNRSDGKPFDVSVSIGVKICSCEDFDFDSAYRLADKKMYEEKMAKGVKR